MFQESRLNENKASESLKSNPPNDRHDDSTKTELSVGIRNFDTPLLLALRHLSSTIECTTIQSRIADHDDGRLVVCDGEEKQNLLLEPTI